MDVDTLMLAFRCNRARADAAVAGTNAAMAQADCTTVRRAAMWCAQIGHETLSLYYDGEVWGPTKQQLKYDPASGSDLARQLGNTVRGDGFRYRGRGRIQLTGKVNYAAFSAWCHARGLVPTADHFVRNPDLVAAAPWRELAAAWYWTVARPGLNAAADRGDVTACTRLINGGANGLPDRQDRYDGALKLGERLLPTGGSAAVATPGGDWFDMATEADLRRIIRDEVGPATWNYPIFDQYTDNPTDVMPAHAQLGYATAHAAHARGDIGAARLELAALRAALAGVTAGSGQPITGDQVAALVRDALVRLGPLHLTPANPAA